MTQNANSCDTTCLKQPYEMSKQMARKVNHRLKNRQYTLR